MINLLVLSRGGKRPEALFESPAMPLHCYFFFGWPFFGSSFFGLFLQPQVSHMLFHLLHCGKISCRSIMTGKDRPENILTFPGLASEISPPYFFFVPFFGAFFIGLAHFPHDIGRSPD
jgi:hypothetical protein